jgi:hypothetical protein
MSLDRSGTSGAPLLVEAQSFEDSKDRGTQKNRALRQGRFIGSLLHAGWFRSAVEFTPKTPTEPESARNSVPMLCRVWNLAPGHCAHAK